MLSQIPFRSLVFAVPAAPCSAQAEAPSLQSAIGNPDNFKLSGNVRVRHETLEGLCDVLTF